MKMTRFLFLGGPSRSGTTLAQGLISNHTAFGPVMEECSHLRFLMEAYVKSLQIYDKTSYDYFGEPADFQLSFQDMLGAYGRRMTARSKAADWLVQKEPTITRYFPELAGFWPESRFVLMSRNFKTVASSQKRRIEAQNKQFDISGFLEAHTFTLRRLRGKWDIFKGRLAIVNFEALVSDPLDVMQNLDDWLGLPPRSEDASFSWDTKRSDKRHDSASPLDGKPPKASRATKFENVLSPSERSEIETKLGELSANMKLPYLFPEISEEASPITLL